MQIFQIVKLLRWSVKIYIDTSGTQTVDHE